MDSLAEFVLVTGSTATARSKKLVYPHLCPRESNLHSPCRSLRRYKTKDREKSNKTTYTIALPGSVCEPLNRYEAADLLKFQSIGPEGDLAAKVRKKAIGRSRISNFHIKCNEAGGKLIMSANLVDSREETNARLTMIHEIN